MRKQTKLVAVLSAAALLAIGASMTSFAATGWAEENGTWVYYDSNGNRVTDTWKKSGNNWFWLDSNGEMATATLIDDGDNTYYVNESGVMAANQWMSMENTDDTSDNAADHNWYYFQSNGKAYKAGTSSTSFKTINGKKYAFDTDGKMLYGWVGSNSELMKEDEDWGNATYYCGGVDDGAQQIGWKQIHVVDRTEDEEDQDYWFYFKSNGKKVYKNSSDNSEGTQTINGKKYIFDERGKMLSKWVDSLSTESVVASRSSVAADKRYYSASTDGSRSKGWFKVVPSKALNTPANEDDEAKWYYAKNDGTLYNSCIKTINNKKYAFNDKAEMLNGLVAITFGTDTVTNEQSIVKYTKLDTEAKLNAAVKNFSDLNTGVFYFGGEDDGSMKLGSQNVTVDGEAYSFMFVKTGDNKGEGFGSARVKSQYVIGSGSTDFVNANIYEKNTFYQNGKKVKADTDIKYMAVDPDGNKETLSTSDTDQATTTPSFLVNSSGSIMKNKKNIKDGNDKYYCTNSYGVITYYNTKAK